jgi:hypothetical protein
MACAGQTRGKEFSDFMLREIAGFAVMLFLVISIGANVRGAFIFARGSSFAITAYSYARIRANRELACTRSLKHKLKYI